MNGMDKLSDKSTLSKFNCFASLLKSFFYVQEGKHEITKVVSLLQNDRKYTRYILSLYYEAAKQSMTILSVKYVDVNVLFS